MGLKTVAPLTGFSWRDEDVGGALAMVRYVEATLDKDILALRAAARQWILDYNEDDVRATAQRCGIGSIKTHEPLSVR